MEDLVCTSRELKLASVRKGEREKAHRIFTLCNYIERRETSRPESYFDFNSASVGGRYLKYGVENYGY